MAGMFLEPQDEQATEPIEDSPFGSDEELLEVWEQCKKESFAERWIFERGWMRNIHYIGGRHWIEYVRRSNEWRDVRLAKWFPKPVTNVIGEGLVALRSMFASVNIGATVRPNGTDPVNVAVAAVCDDYAPLLHEDHNMEDVLDEADYWFIATGNAFLHTYLERDMKHGVDVIDFEQCVACQQIYSPDMIQAASGKCPDPTCPGNATGMPAQFVPAMSPETGAPIQKMLPKGKGVTVALSPFEIAFNYSYARFEDVPYVIRLRWRPKTYYQNSPALMAQTKDFKWVKAPSDTSLQLFRSLPYQNDMGVAPFLGNSTGQNEEEGAPEYEVWFRPCDQYPKGLVFRVLGDSKPVILHQEDEGLPGEIPYQDAEGNPVFTFTHAPFDSRGGRVYGTSPLDGAIQKQNQLNQLDAFILMIINRMSNPLWLVPKGAEIEKFTGEPGLVVKWNPLTVGGNAKPERVDGVGPNQSLFAVREQYLHDIENAMGTYDVLKGSRPAGVEAFSAMQLLVERGQSRFTSAFKARGHLYKDWLKFALEIEREFGPVERVKAVMGPARTWTQKAFQNSQLQGCFGVVVEDGSTTPKTALGMRASVEHLNQLGFIDHNDPDQKYKVLQLFGQTALAPTLDLHMQAALRKQDAFEQWAGDPAAMQKSIGKFEQAVQGYQQQLVQMQAPPEVPGAADPATGAPIGPPQPQPMLPPPPSITTVTPLAWKPWFNAVVHKQEFMKWANGDKVREMIEANPGIEQILVAHLAEIDQNIAMQMPPQPAPAPKPGGAGQAMKNSNQESGSPAPGGQQAT